MYDLSGDGLRYLCSHGLTVPQMVCVTLRFLASGSFFYSFFLFGSPHWILEWREQKQHRLKHCIAVMVTVCTEILTSLSSFWISKSSFLSVRHLISRSSSISWSVLFFNLILTSASSVSPGALRIVLTV